MASGATPASTRWFPEPCSLPQGTLNPTKVSDSLHIQYPGDSTSSSYAIVFKVTPHVLLKQFISVLNWAGIFCTTLFIFYSATFSVIKWVSSVRCCFAWNSMPWIRHSASLPLVALTKASGQEGHASSPIPVGRNHQSSKEERSPMSILPPVGQFSLKNSNILVVVVVGGVGSYLVCSLLNGSLCCWFHAPPSLWLWSLYTCPWH